MRLAKKGYIFEKNVAMSVKTYALLLRAFTHTLA